MTDSRFNTTRMKNIRVFFCFKYKTISNILRSQVSQSIQYNNLVNVCLLAIKYVETLFLQQCNTVHVLTKQP